MCATLREREREKKGEKLGGSNHYPADPLLCSQGYRGDSLERPLWYVFLSGAHWEKKILMQATMCPCVVHSTAAAMLWTAKTRSD